MLTDEYLLKVTEKELEILLHSIRENKNNIDGADGVPLYMKMMHALYPEIRENARMAAQNREYEPFELFTGKRDFGEREKWR